MSTWAAEAGPHRVNEDQVGVRQPASVAVDQPVRWSLGVDVQVIHTPLGVFFCIENH